MSEAPLVTERHGHTVLLTLNRPERLNALSVDLRDALTAALDAVRDDDSVRAVVLTGRGFCSGADLGGAPPAETQLSQNEMLDEFGWVGRQALSVYHLDKPVICALNGVAAGAGMSLALAADVRIGCEHSRFKTVFIERNLSPDSGMSFFLPRIVGYSRAADLVFSSRRVDADEAYRLGLLDRLVGAQVLLNTALELAEEMTQWPPVALRASKRVLQHNQEVGLEEALRYELFALSHGRKAKNDANESRLAFVEKRKPTYTGT